MLLLSAFFSGLEIAFLSVNKLRVELKNSNGSKWASMVSSYLKEPSKFISTILVGNNVALVIYGSLMEESLVGYFDNFMKSAAAILLAVLVSTFIVLIVAEFLPKALFRLNPSGILSVLIFPFQMFYVLLFPVVRFVMWLSKFILERVFKQEFTKETPEFTKVDLDHFITQSTQGSDEEEQDVDTDILKMHWILAMLKLGIAWCQELR